MNRFQKLFLIALSGIFTISQSYAERLEETFKKQIPAENITFLSIENQNGNIDVEGWDQNVIEITAYKRVRASDSELAQELMERLEIDVRISGDRVEVETILPRDHNKDTGFLSWLFSGHSGSTASVEYSVRIPVKMDLDLNSTNGEITLNKCEGQIDLHTTNGKIIADDIEGSLNCKSTNGSIKAYLNSINPKEDMNFKTTNGSIKLYLPPKTNADLEASTTNGSIQCDLPITSSRSQSRHKLYGEMNDGGPLIYMKTTNGSIRIYEI